MDEYKQEASASEVVVSNFGEFADFAVQRKFPHVSDGLLQVHRRILWTLNTEKSTQKVSTLGGKVLELHPHGDQSVFSTIISLAQPFTNIVPIIGSPSGLGTYAGASPTAARYVDVHSAEFTRDVFFNNTNMNTLIIQPGEIGKGETEPAYFIPAIPFALLAGCFSLVVGYQSETVALGLQALCQLTSKYITMRSTMLDWDVKTRTSLAHLIIPDFPSYGVLRNREELIAAYRKRNYIHPAVIDGVLTITPTSICINAVAPGGNMARVFTKATELNEKKDSFIAQGFSEFGDHAGRAHGNTIGNLEFTMKRGYNPFDYLDQMKKFVRFTIPWKPTPHYINKQNKMVRADPFDLLDMWYRERYSSMLGELKIRQIALVKKHRELTALIIVADNSDKVYEIFNTAVSTDDAVIKLVRTFRDKALTEYQAKFLASLQMQQLTKVGKNQLLADKDANLAKIKELQLEFTMIPQRMKETVEFIGNKYGSKYPRKCKIADYIGCMCYKGTGFIQAESLDELEQLQHTFGDEAEIILYQGTNFGYSVNETNIQDGSCVSFPKQFKANNFYMLNHRAKHTVGISSSGASVAEGLVCKDVAGTIFVPVASRFVAVCGDGVAELISVEKEHYRKNLSCARASIPNVVYADPFDVSDFIVVHANTAESNIIKIDRINNKGKTSKIVVGKWKVLGVFDARKPFIINIPSDYRNRTPIKSIYLPSMTDMLTVGKTATIHLGKKTFNGKVGLVLRNKKSSLWTIKK